MMEDDEFEYMVDVGHTTKKYHTISEDYIENLKAATETEEKILNLYKWDVNLNRWYGVGANELLLNEQNKYMTGEQLEQAVKSIGQVSGIQSKLDKLVAKVDGIKDISDYVECEVCGSLVRNSKAQVFSSVEIKINLSSVLIGLYGCNATSPENVAVLHYVCNHCDAKKYENELKRGS